jgi:hypothetical protein
LNFIQSYATPIIEEKLSTYSPNTGRDIEALIPRDDYISSLTDLQFRNGLLSVQSYYDTITSLYNFPTVQSNPEALVKSAEARITLHHNVNLLSDSETMNLSWSALTTALGNLTTASKLPDVENLAGVHILRGDVELLRYQMGVQGYEPSKKSAAVLLKNAEVFYRGGKNVGKAAGGQGVEREGGVKEGLVKGLRGDGEGMMGLLKGMGESEVAKVVSDAVEDGLVSKMLLKELGINL